MVITGDHSDEKGLWSWRSCGVELGAVTSGEQIKKKIALGIKIKGYMVHASKEEPQY